jgi:hypothetical protein
MKKQLTTNIAVPGVLQEDINRAVKILKEGGCTEIYLFGSGVTGEVRNGSDIDLAVRGCPHGHWSGEHLPVYCKRTRPAGSYWRPVEDVQESAATLV